MAKVHVKKNDQVLILAGKEKTKRGKVLEVSPSTGRVIVEGLNQVQRHLKPNSNKKNPQGGIISKSASIHISNVMVIDPKTNEPSRIGRRMEKGGKDKKESRVRYAKRSNTVLA